MMLWGDDSEKKALETQNKILSAMYDEEKTQAKLDKAQIKEVSEVSGATIEEV